MKTKILTIISFVMAFTCYANAQSVNKQKTETTTSLALHKVKIICENYKYFIADSLTGKHIKDLSNYDSVWDFSQGFACVKLFNKWGFIDSSGKEIVTPKYDKVYSFSEGLASVKLDRKWGFIDTTGKEVIALKYDNAFGFSNGLAIVELGGRSFKIDKTGNEVIP